MPSLKVSELSNASLPLTGTELLAISQTAKTVKTTAGDVADSAFGDVAAIYEFNIPINKALINNTLSFLDNFAIYKISNNAKTITVYKGTSPIQLVYSDSYIDYLSEDLSLKWTIGGSLYFQNVDISFPRSFKILETPKIVNNFFISSAGIYLEISTFNINIEHASLIDVNPTEFTPSIMDMSSLKSCSDIFRISFATAGKTLDVSGLEQWGRFGNSINLLAPFVNIILPTNLKSAANTINFNLCAFTQAAVDAILELLVSLDGTAGKDTWGDDPNISYSLDLGGSNAAPSVAGLANKAILNARLNTTVVTN